MSRPPERDIHVSTEAEWRAVQRVGVDVTPSRIKTWFRMAADVTDEHSYHRRRLHPPRRLVFPYTVESDNTHVIKTVLYAEHETIDTSHLETCPGCHEPKPSWAGAFCPYCETENQAQTG